MIYHSGESDFTSDDSRIIVRFWML